MPAAFGDEELEALRAQATADPRLAQALAHCEEGQVIQYLAGGPAQLERYRTAPAAAKALISAAIDARRLGHGPLLPASLLTSAARVHDPASA